MLFALGAGCSKILGIGDLPGLQVEHDAAVVVEDAEQADADAAACPAGEPDTCTVGGVATCTNLTTDVANCGACGETCDIAQACSPAGCVDACPFPAQPDAVVLFELSPTGGNIIMGTNNTVSITVEGYYRDHPYSPTDVTNLATFVSSDPSLVAVNASGVASSPAGTPGIATVTVTVGSVSRSLKIRVWDPARYATLTSLTPTAPGLGTFGLRNGECFPVSMSANFSDNSTEDVSETIDWGTVDYPSGTTKTRAAHVIDQNLLVLTGFRADGASFTNYTEMRGWLTPGGRNAGFLLYLGTGVYPFNGVCSDPRSPGDVLGVYMNPLGRGEQVQPTLEVGESVRYWAYALHADFSLRMISDRIKPRSCDAGVSTTERWITGLAVGTRTFGATYAGKLGLAKVTVVAAQSHPTLASLFVSPVGANVTPGKPYALAAFARYADTGPTRQFNVSTQATWSSSDVTITANPVAGAGTTTALVGTSAIGATYSGQTASGAVRSWDVARLASLTGFLSNDLGEKAQGSCGQITSTATFNNDPGDTEDVTSTTTFTKYGTCFGTLSSTGYWWTSGPFCANNLQQVAIEVSGGFGFPSTGSVVSAQPDGVNGDTYKDSSCVP